MATTQMPALDNTMGVLYIGVTIAMALWGAGTVQCYYYFNRYANDNKFVKLLVAVVWALDTTHQGLIIHTTYIYLITEYGNWAFLALIVPTLLIEVIVSALICLLVQSFLVFRVWRLSGKHVFLVCFLMSLVFAEFVVAIVYSAEALGHATWADLTKIAALSKSINAIGAAGDLVIACVLIFLLHRARTGFQRSETMINKLILFTINTGLLTSLCAIASLITITALPNTFVYVMFYVTVSKLYTNSLLATLNARKGLRGQPDSSEDISVSLGNMRNRGNDYEMPQTLPTKSGRALSIKVDTETTRDFYGDSSKALATGSPNDIPFVPYNAKNHGQV